MTYVTLFQEMDRASWRLTLTGRSSGHEPSWHGWRTVMTAAFWAVLAVAVVVVIGVGIFVLVRNRRRKAPSAEYDRTPPEKCRANGHTYRIDGTAWRCATCGNNVPRREGELYGPAEEGRVDRRREDREP